MQVSFLGGFCLPLPLLLVSMWFREIEEAVLCEMEPRFVVAGRLLAGTGAPEFRLLTDILGDEHAARLVATAPGDWRSLDVEELRALGLDDHHVRVVTAVQILALRSWPSMPRHKLIDGAEVAQVYTPRLAGELDEVVVAVALDADGFFRNEIEVGRNTGKGLGLEAATVLRAMIKAGAETFVVVLNNPSGKPLVSPDLKYFTEKLDAAGEAVGILLVDVVVIGARDSGWRSLRAEGIVGAEDDT
jgi:DNA repair protein RadC